jgi:hypothetical protein
MRRCISDPLLRGLWVCSHKLLAMTAKQGVFAALQALSLTDPQLMH